MRWERKVIGAIDVHDLELAASAKLGGEATTPEVETLEQDVADLEKNLLQRMYREFPSTRKLAALLGASHSAIAMRLQRYGIGRG